MLNPRDDESVLRLCSEFVLGLRAVIASKLVAVYVYGAVTFPETTHTGDVDFHVILTAPPTERERAELLALHERLAAQFPPLGAELDGYYILESGTRSPTPPRHLLFPHLADGSWALHRAHILAGRVLVLYGPDPKTIHVAPTWAELEQALDGELAYVAEHLGQYPAYCILNLGRLLYSWETRDVVISKAAAADWARSRFPAWAALVDLATASYAGQIAPQEREKMEAGVAGFLAFAEGRIASLRARRG